MHSNLRMFILYQTYLVRKDPSEVSRSLQATDVSFLAQHMQGHDPRRCVESMSARISNSKAAGDRRC